MLQAWVYIYGSNSGETTARGIGVHADEARVNVNIWLTPEEVSVPLVLSNVQHMIELSYTLIHSL